MTDWRPDSLTDRRTDGPIDWPTDWVTDRSIEFLIDWLFDCLFNPLTHRYGDRSPKSALGRVFCILWIITGVIIISIFTALVTASLSASTLQIFKIHGSKVKFYHNSTTYHRRKCPCIPVNNTSLSSSFPSSFSTSSLRLSLLYPTPVHHQVNWAFLFPHVSWCSRCLRTFMPQWLPQSLTHIFLIHH